MAQFLQLLFAGLALGANYALVALGFVIIYKSTGVLNFAQGGLLMMGAYFTYHLINNTGLPFPIALLIAMCLTGLLGIVVEELVLRHMVGRPDFTVIMATWALLIILEQLPPPLWGHDIVNLGDPWGIAMTKLGSLPVFTIDLWTLVFVAVAVVVLFVFFRFTLLGVAMRATASDQEAAIAQGISPGLVFATAWFIAGAMACLAGTMLSGGARVISPELSMLALLAFPAVVLGGIESPAGAVAGGLIIGIAEVMTAAFGMTYMPWLGHNFHQVLPYVILVVLLMVRPYGLLGSAGGRRV
ncbi:MAG: branched-chain amino acid transport system permease protein [Hyphomicrobiales bacterium]|jgi:branched-chain amino acid transport system permease protein|nr:branched-chain amino acid transport system permease protein [Hyphomicrobiales bacterium]